MMSFGRTLRRASPDEVRESVNVTVLFVDARVHPAHARRRGRQPLRAGVSADFSPPPGGRSLTTLLLSNAPKGRLNGREGRCPHKCVRACPCVGVALAGRRALRARAPPARRARRALRRLRRLRGGAGGCRRGAAVDAADAGAVGRHRRPAGAGARPPRCASRAERPPWPPPPQPVWRCSRSVQSRSRPVAPERATPPIIVDATSMTDTMQEIDQLRDARRAPAPVRRARRRRRALRHAASVTRSFRNERAGRAATVRDVLPNTVTAYV